MIGGNVSVAKEGGFFRLSLELLNGVYNNAYMDVRILLIAEVATILIESVVLILLYPMACEKKGRIWTILLVTAIANMVSFMLLSPLWQACIFGGGW